MSSHNNTPSHNKNRCLRVQVSYTPIVGMFLNWPPVLRSLLASIWLFGIMPPKVKDYQQMLLPVVEQFAQYAPGPTGENLRVFDEDLGVHRDLRVMLAYIINDIRAIPSGTCGTHPPAYVGSCNFCKQAGRRIHSRMVLGGAVRSLGVGICSYTTHLHTIPYSYAQPIITHHTIITNHLIIKHHPIIINHPIIA
jgi:hypothetical protein